MRDSRLVLERNRHLADLRMAAEGARREVVRLRAIIASQAALIVLQDAEIARLKCLPGTR